MSDATPCQGHLPAPAATVYPRAPVCIACGERERFQVAVPDGGVEICRRTVFRPAIRLVGCGRCGSRHSIVLETAWD